METIRIQSTSKNSAVGEEIVLREKDTTRLIFRTELVNNLRDKNSSVRGCFIFQKKKLSGNWSDYHDFPLSKLKDGEWIKLPLTSNSVSRLIDGIIRHRQIYEEYGIIIGKSSFVFNSTNIDDFFRQFIQRENKELIVEKLQDLEINDLQSINSIIGIGRLKKALAFFIENKDNKNEEVWQNYFKDNAWIISQIFTYPLVLLQDKAYLGGKSIDNKGGSIVDYIFKNEISNNIALVEIKTPNTKLLSLEYRDDVFSIHQDLTGAIVQALNYKDKIQKEYANLQANTYQNFSIFNPKCLLIAGKFSQLDSEAKKKSFELFRCGNKDIDIVTYTEVFEKIKNLLKLLEE